MIGRGHKAHSTQGRQQGAGVCMPGMVRHKEGISCVVCAGRVGCAKNEERFKVW